VSRNGSSHVLPRLPCAFWQAIHGARDAWQGLEGILDEEWEGLRRNEISVLWETADKKTMQAAHIQEKEAALTHMARLITERCGLVGHDDWRMALRSVVHPSDLSRFEAELFALRRVREEAMERNRRHGRWIGERLDLTKAIARVLVPVAEDPPALYGPSGGLSGERRRPLFKQGDF